MPHKKTVFLPRSTREVKKHLKPPLSRKSAVVYFTVKDGRPFLLDSEGGGVSAEGEFKLSNDWKLSTDKLDRIVIITVDNLENHPEEGD